MRHKAFLSHNHAIDADLATALEKALQNFAKPTFKRKAISVFRDASDLSATPDLWGKLEEGLEETEYFVWMASSASAASKWCRNETVFWRENKSMDNFLIVLTEGDLYWDDEKGDYDYQKSTSIPDTLSGAFKNEPLFVDLRETRKAETLDLDNVDFKQKVAMIAATLHGKSLSDMIGEEITVHKRNTRIKRVAITALSILFVTAVVAVIIAETQRRTAVYNTKVALNNSYMMQSQLLADKAPTSSLRLAEFAYKWAVEEHLPIAEPAANLIKAYYNPLPFHLVPQEGEGQIQVRSPVTEIDAKSGITRIEIVQGQLYGYDKSGRRILLPNEYYEYHPFTSATFFGDQKYILAYYTWGFAVFDLDGTLLDHRSVVGNDRVPTGGSPVGSPVAPYVLDLDNEQGAITLFDYSKSPVEVSGFFGHVRPVEFATYSDDGQFVLTASQDGTSVVWHIYGHRKVTFNGHLLRGLENAYFADEGRNVVTRDVTGTTRFWHLENPPKHFSFSAEMESHSLYALVGLRTNTPIFELVDLDDEVIAVFDRGNRAVAQKSALGYTLTIEGLKDAKDLFLIQIFLPQAEGLQQEPPTAIFSEDEKFILVEPEYGPYQVYPIDPDFIIDLINDDERYGSIWELDDETRNEYGIPDLTKNQRQKAANDDRQN